CESNDECPYDNTCVNRLCLDICHPGICGENADCLTIGNRPSCVCPAGTTGNPTYGCTAINIEKSPLPLSPIGDPTKPINIPVHPIAGQSSTHPPPNAIYPTQNPITTTPRPPIKIIVPPISIACANNDDCTLDNSCINNLCYDVCSLGICGEDADCKIHEHRPICNCPPGTTGDPLIGCMALVSHTTTTLSPLGLTTPSLSNPVSPLAVPSRPGLPPLPEIPSPKPKQPTTPIPPIPPTPGPVPVGCESTDDCPFENSCINRLCMDVCYPGFCGDNADCQTVGHRPVCICPPGTTGNPTIKCSALATERPPAPPVPIGEARPPQPGDPIIPDSITNPPPKSPATSTTPRSPIPTINPPPPPPFIPEIQIACENNDECDMDNSCINMMCLDSCSLNLCGEDTDCQTINHRPVCICPPGTTGDPQVQCTALISEVSTTLKPIADRPPGQPPKEIIPISGPTTVQPYPLTELPVIITSITTK
ncbi:unnamed protein product, partial [Meganyctiphanes norvegica]